MARGAAPGERRGGRQKGTPNKATADVKALAGKYAEEAFAELARIATKAESEAARVAAIKEILDRAFGKSKQPLEHDTKDGKPIPLSFPTFSDKNVR